jgi:GAF domain-containing protein/HAMP domain-containing protein
MQRPGETTKTTVRTRLALAFVLVGVLAAVAALMAERAVGEMMRGMQVAAFVIGGASLALVLLSVGASLLLARTVSKPLVELTATATRIAKGELELAAQTGRTDEIGALASALNGMNAALRESISLLKQRVDERTRILQTAAQVSHATTSMLDPDKLLERVVNVVRDRFGLYYVGLFLLDAERQSAVLRAGTGDAGRQMVARAHRLAIGGQSMIGQCVAQNRAVIQLHAGEAEMRYANPLLPETRSELALPMRSRGRVIGAVTVQSEQDEAFDEAYVSVLQTMADQVAIAIDNAQLFAEAQAALERAQAIHSRYLGQAWADYIRSRPVGGYEYARGFGPTGAVVRPLHGTIPPEVAQALSQGHSSVSAVANGAIAGSSVVISPIRQGGQVVAALGLGKEGEWTADEIALVEAVAEQVGLAVANQRLLEETQRRAAREELVRRITGRISAAADMEGILAAASETLGHELGASEVVIRLGAEGTWAGHGAGGLQADRGNRHGELDQADPRGASIRR